MADSSKHSHLRHVLAGEITACHQTGSSVKKENGCRQPRAGTESCSALKGIWRGNWLVWFHESSLNNIVIKFPCSFLHRTSFLLMCLYLKLKINTRNGKTVISQCNWSLAEDGDCLSTSWKCCLGFFGHTIKTVSHLGIWSYGCDRCTEYVCYFLDLGILCVCRLGCS